MSGDTIVGYTALLPNCFVSALRISRALFKALPFSLFRIKIFPSARAEYHSIGGNSNSREMRMEPGSDAWEHDCMLEREVHLWDASS